MEERTGPTEAAPTPGPSELELRLADAERRAYWAITRVGELQAEIERFNEWRRITVGAVVAVALFAILMFGLVAFKVADTGDDGPTGAAGLQLTERVVARQ